MCNNISVIQAISRANGGLIHGLKENSWMRDWFYKITFLPRPPYSRCDDQHRSGRFAHLMMEGLVNAAQMPLGSYL